MCKETTCAADPLLWAGCAQKAAVTWIKGIRCENRKKTCHHNDLKRKLKDSSGLLENKSNLGGM